MKVNALHQLQNMQKLEILACFPVDKSTNLGWMALIQGTSGGYHENKIIRSNSKWTTVRYILNLFSTFENLRQRKRPIT